MTAHAIRHHGKACARNLPMRDECDPVLLFFAITLVLGDTGVKLQSHCGIFLLCAVMRTSFMIVDPCNSSQHRSDSIVLLELYGYKQKWIKFRQKRGIP
jgi:hypothetical protein